MPRKKKPPVAWLAERERLIDACESLRKSSEKLVLEVRLLIADKAELSKQLTEAYVQLEWERRPWWKKLLRR